MSFDVTHDLDVLRRRLAELTGRDEGGTFGSAAAPSHEIDLALGLLETARVVVLVLDAERRIRYVNRFFEGLTGYALAEVEGADWFEAFLAPADAARLHERFEGAIRGDSTEGNVNPIACKDGSIRTIEWYDRVLRDAQGQSVGILAIGHDVSARARAVKTLAEANLALEERVAARTADLSRANAELSTTNQLLEGTFEASTVCLAYLDRDFDFVRVNRQYAAADQRDPEFFAGKNHFALFPNADAEAIFRRVRDTGRPESVVARPFEYEQNKERGVSHWDWTLTPVLDPGGEVTGLVLALSDVSDRVNALQTLQDREHLHKEAQALARLGSWQLELTNERFECSAELARVLGCERPGEAADSYAAFLARVHPDDRAEVEEAHRRTRRSGEPAEFSHRVRVGDEVRHVRHHCRLEGAGLASRLFGTLQDVTPEVEARRAATIRDAAIESSLNAIALADPQGVLTYVNQAFLRLWELDDKADALGRSALEFWEDPEAAAAVLATLHTDGAWRGRLRARARSGRLFTTEFAANLVTDEQGAPLCTLGAFVDVTAEEETQRLLAVSEEQFRTTFEQVAVGMVLCDPDGTITRANQRMAEISGYPLQELVGLDLAALAPGEDELAAPLRYLLDGSGAAGVAFAEVPLRRRGGERRWTSVTLSPRLAPDGSLAQLLGVLQDVDARKQAEERIARQLAEKEVLLREVHHRVKNNLHVISSLLYFQAEKSGDPAVRALFAESNARVQAMSLVHEALYESDDLEHVDFARYLERLTAAVAASHEAPGCAVEVRCEVDAPPLTVEQAIPCGLVTSELVTNAFKYAFPGRDRGRITCSLRRGEGEQLVLAICDDGVGFAAELLDAPATLGLRLVRALGEQLGGGVAATAGPGARVEVRFPYAPRGGR